MLTGGSGARRRWSARLEGSTVMGRTASKAQEAKARARKARLGLLVERNAQDERIEDAAAAVLLAWQDRSAALAQVEEAERAAAAALVLLARERVLVRDMVALTGIEALLCQRLLRRSVESRDGSPDGPGGGPDAAR